jgi:hypothetical protein
MLGSWITFVDLEALCHQAVAVQPASMDGHRPTPQQVFFFTLVWIVKTEKTLTINREGEHLGSLRLNQLDVDALRDHAHLVTRQLHEWGAVVAQLKQGNDQEWELLRIQMEKAARDTARYYGCLYVITVCHTRKTDPHTLNCIGKRPI